MGMWTDAKVKSRSKRGEEFGYVTITRFDDNGDIGISTDQIVREGADMFHGQDFVNALWELYPDGLPPKTEPPLSKTEEAIRDWALTVLNGILAENGHRAFEGTYEDALGLWHYSMATARAVAEAYVATLDDED